jgi:hypothetical protein
MEQPKEVSGNGAKSGMAEEKPPVGVLPEGVECPIGTKLHSEHDRKLLDLAAEIVDLERFRDTCARTPRLLAEALIKSEDEIKALKEKLEKARTALQDHMNKFHPAAKK